MSEKARREQLKYIQRAIDEYYWSRSIRDELGVACQRAFELLIESEREKHDERCDFHKSTT